MCEEQVELNRQHRTPHHATSQQVGDAKQLDKQHPQAGYQELDLASCVVELQGIPLEVVHLRQCQVHQWLWGRQDLMPQVPIGVSEREG